MSQNLVSQPLVISNKEMDPIPNKLAVPMPGMTGGMSSSPGVRKFDASHKQMGLVQPMPNKSGYYSPSPSNRHMGQKDMRMSEIGLSQYRIPSQHESGSMAHVLSNQGAPKISLPMKRTASGEHTLGNSVGQQGMIPNKNMSQIEAFTNKSGMQQALKPAANKKMVRNDSVSGRSGSKQAQTPKSRTMQMEPSPKNQAESLESVRSKMRESLASALALVTEQQAEASKDNVNTSGDSAVNSEKESSGVDKDFEGQCTSEVVVRNGGMGDSAQGDKSNEPEFQYATTALSGEEFPFADSFFVQDELLQGNGLTWAMDLSVDARETKEVEVTKKPKLVEQNASEVGNEEALPSPQSLASKIEAELFKLFGGVNKKYKEKGRSLLFNLKDRNNPELRERVMSGEISPERLCAMSAEELASKELSEWRMAKAEELAQMVVLPESDVDIRRLVKKTHKGEFQVEVEQDDGVSVEVSVGTSTIARPKRDNKGADPSPKVDKSNGKDNVVREKSGSDNQDISCSLTIPNDVVETDYMQGLMSDEFKDAEFLPPIVSLDEFMQSLDTEPPFENLQVDGEKTGSPSDKESSEGGDHVIPAGEASREPLNASAEVSDKVDTKHVDSSVKIKPSQGSEEAKLSLPSAALIGERVWEGLLQLNVSAGVNAVGFFRSGEKTSTKEWPALLEIKGRVRLDAFEKFIQGLPMSRSRAVMLAHFALKEGSSDADHASLGEAVHSYVLDERLGIAEPVPGAVEIYFCPPHLKVLEMLSKNLSKSHTNNLNSIQKGLIGVIVWRRINIASNLSPKSTGHHKHVSKKPHKFSSTSTTVSNNMSNVKSTPHQRAAPARPPPSHQFNDEDDDDDDIPPGFGPAPPCSRDVDDLPEFSFSGGPMHLHKQNMPNSRPVDQMRELVLKYGQTGNNINNNSSIGPKRWDDDDDDIPEWQPGHQPSHQPMMNYPNLQQQQQIWSPLQANDMVQGHVRSVNQPPPGLGQRQHPSANLGSQVYGLQRYPRTRGF